MAGYTDSVVIEAPLFWWPALGELTKYPLDQRQSFLAAISDGAMPWQSTIGVTGDTAAMHTVGLSRLGRSVWATAAWSPAVEGDEQLFVQLWNPISAAVLHLPVCTTAGLGSCVKTREELSSCDIRQLARDGRVRLTNRADASVLCGSSSASLKHVFESAQRRARQHPAYPLLHRVLALVHAAALRHLRCVVPAAGVASSCSITAVLPSPAGSFLFTGDTPSQRHLQHLLQLSTPTLIPLDSTHVIALEARRLNLAEVLTLNEHEALEAIEVLLRPPPLISPSPSAVTNVVSVLLPCLAITLEGLELLEANTNSLVAGVVHQLCMCLEALRDGQVPTLIWSFAQDVNAMPVALLSRVGAQHVRLSSTTQEDRAAYLNKRLVDMQHDFASPPSDCLHNTTTTAVVDALAEETARWTVDRLVRLRDAELLKLCTARTPAAPSPSLSHSPASVASLPGTEQEPLHEVYGHLYGMDDDIRKVEELVVWPLTHLSQLQALSIPCSKGVLICGPSGAGKTALLSGVVRRLQLPDTRGIHVLSVDGLSLIEKEVGRSEKNIAQLFETARALAPTALFIDNLDALAPPRGRATSETNTTADRTLSTLLTQMDGVGGQVDRVVVVVASAPSLGTLDPAVCRPGRLDVHVHLRQPPAEVSAAFVKRRLRVFTLQVYARLGFSANCAIDHEASAVPFVDELVDRYFTALAADSNAKVDEDKENGLAVSTTMSPAEVSAVVREVMLHVAENVSHVALSTEDDTKRGELISEVQRCMAEAFASLVVV